MHAEKMYRPARIVAVFCYRAEKGRLRGFVQRPAGRDAHDGVEPPENLGAKSFGSEEGRARRARVPDDAREHRPQFIEVMKARLDPSDEKHAQRAAPWSRFARHDRLPGQGLAQPIDERGPRGPS